MTASASSTSEPVVDSESSAGAPDCFHRGAQAQDASVQPLRQRLDQPAHPAFEAAEDRWGAGAVCGRRRLHLAQSSHERSAALQRLAEDRRRGRGVDPVDVARTDAAEQRVDHLRRHGLTEPGAHDVTHAGGAGTHAHSASAALDHDVGAIGASPAFREPPRQHVVGRSPQRAQRARAAASGRADPAVWAPRRSSHRAAVPAVGRAS